MPRLSLPELEDYAWYPSLLRRAQTDYLRWLMETFDVYRAVMPRVEALMRATGQSHFTDLCSGGGGSLLMVQRALHKHAPDLPFSATLSDLYPNLAAFETVRAESGQKIEYQVDSVDAARIQWPQPGIVSIFNGFHHLPPAAAQRVLSQAAQARQPLLILEPIEKSLWQLVVNLLALTVLMLVAMPFVRPAHWSKYVFTYLIPLIPLCTLWDGFASVARLYALSEIKKMTQQAGNEGYVWEYGYAGHAFGRVFFLIGRPLLNA